jgi:hypothetical protein
MTQYMVIIRDSPDDVNPRMYGPYDDVDVAHEQAVLKLASRPSTAAYEVFIYNPGD